MKKKTHGLTILMLKSNVTDESQAIKDLASLSTADVTLGSITGKLFFKQNPSHPPSWVKLFQPKIGNTLSSLYNSGSSAVFLIRSGTVFFVLTFGYGKSLLLTDSYEENFGLRVVLNSVDPEKLRSVDVQSLDAVPLSRRNQASIATNLSDFGLDIEQDLIYAATGQPKDVLLGRQITGKDVLKVSIPLDVDDIPALLLKLETQYKADTYKNSFAWIDNLSEVRAKSLVDTLDNLLTSKIQAKLFDKTWLAIPEIIEWSDIAGFKYQKPKQGNLHDDIAWDSYLAFLGTDAPHSVETFKKQDIYAISESSGQQLHTWSVYRCIYCELSHDGADYALNNGKWFKVNTDFLKSLNDSINLIPTSTLTLPDYKGNDEGAYNESVHKDNATYYALMDKKMIYYGGGHSQIEFCDLFSVDKHLLHVKRYGGSSVLSHLFAQGTVSARLLLSDADFRKKVNDLLPSSHQLESIDQKPKAHEFEVVYVIASNSSGASANGLPLFSKINLRNSFNQLQMYGMKVSLKFVPVTATV
jgi:uncharacterized protein (TIGR04141 family)